MIRPCCAKPSSVLAQVIFWALLVAAVSTQVAAADFPILAIGSKAPDFELPGVDDKNYSLADFANGKLLVVIFSCNHCPTAQAYEDRMIQLYHDYHGRGVEFVVISPNDPAAVNLGELGYSDLGDSLADMKIRAKEKGYPFPYLYDGETQQTSQAYGVVATPHIYVFDAGRQLRYTGRIDDGEVRAPKSHDARQAMDALLAGQQVAVPVTKVFGCSTKWKSKRAATERLVAKWDEEPVEVTLIDAAGVKNLRQASENYRLVNVWATWCAPCVQELPDFVDLHRMYRRRHFELITISMDEPDQGEAVKQTLQRLHASMTNYHYNQADKDALVEALDAEWNGPVPHTVLIDPAGKIVYRSAGPIEVQELRKTIVDRLGRTYASRKKKR